MQRKAGLSLELIIHRWYEFPIRQGHGWSDQQCDGRKLLEKQCG